MKIHHPAEFFAIAAVPDCTARTIITPPVNLKRWKCSFFCLFKDCNIENQSKSHKPIPWT